MPSVRARREGSLFLRRRDKHWVAMVTMPDGRRRSASDPSKTLAADLLKDLIRQRDEAVPENPRKLRLGAYLRHWIASVPDLAPATLRQHRGIIENHLIPAFGHRLLTELAPSEIDAYLARRDLDPQTRRHHRATLRRALADAVRDNLVQRNVAALSKPPRMHKAERRWLKAAEARRIIEEAHDERYWPLWVLILTTGLRVSEALGLAWSDVDLVNGRLTVRLQLRRRKRRDADYDPKKPWVRVPLKTRQSRRSIELTPMAVDALTEQGRRQDAERGTEPEPIDGLVFTTASGLPIHSTNVLPSWYAVLRRLGLPRVTTHDLRHSAASMMLAAGVPLPVIAQILGHSSIRVTADLYSHVGVELKRDAAVLLARSLAE